MAKELTKLFKKTKISQEHFEIEKNQSLLFGPMEAANVDRETVFSIGQSGLQELIKFSSCFQEFKITLFSPNSVNFDRAVQDATVNKNLDIEIEKFLLLLSPYFLMTACHKVLEWLICRYYILKYNRDQFILLILPYHGTYMFVKALNMLDLSYEDDKWYWLASVQKRGLQLDFGTLINHLSTDDGLLQMLCTHVITAADLNAQQVSKNLLTTQRFENPTIRASIIYVFFANSVKGLIEYTSTITEVQMNYLLPTLFYCLESPIPDVVSNSYVIIMTMTTKIKFSLDIAEKLLLKTFEDVILKPDATLLLLDMYQNPFNELTVVPQSLVLRLSELSWLFENITNLHPSNANASPFIVSFVQAAFQMAFENPTEITINVQNMITNLLTSIKLNDNAVDIILSNVLSSHFLKNDMSKTTMDLFLRFYKIFEHCYPERFDRYLKSLMKQSENECKSKQLLHIFTSCLFGEETQKTFEILYKLMHVNVEHRISALKLLVENNVSENCRETMISMLQDRFHDDVSVVKILLSFPTKRLMDLLKTNVLIDELLILVSTCHTKLSKTLAKPALKLLLQLCEESDDVRVFIALLPYLFPIEIKDIELTKQVLDSNFAKNNIYMRRMIEVIYKSELTNVDTLTNAITSIALRNILDLRMLPPMESVVNSVQQQFSHGDAVSLFFNMILLGSMCKVPVGSMSIKTARDIIDMTTKMISTYPTVVLLRTSHNIFDNFDVALSLASIGCLSLQASTYVIEMVHIHQLNIKSESKLDFEDDAERSNLILLLIEMFIEGMDNCDWRQHYSRCLQIFFQAHFATAKDLICFLAQLYSKPIKTQTSCYCLSLTLLILDQCKNVQWAFRDQDFVSNLLLALARSNDNCRILALGILTKLTQISNVDTEPFFVLLRELMVKNSEILQDPNQILSYLCELFLPKTEMARQSKQRKKLQQAQKLLFDMIIQQNETSNIPMNRKAQLLDLLAQVNNVGILRQLIPLGFQLLSKVTKDPESLSAGSALRNILQRFNEHTVGVLNDELAWKFFETSIVKYEPRIVFTETGERTSPSIVLLKQIDEEFFEKAGRMHSELQEKILSKILDVMTDCEINEVVYVAEMAFNRIHINARLVRSELELMKSSSQIQERSTSPETRKRAKKRKKQNQIPSTNPTMSQDRAWKRGMILLKFLPHAENIKCKELLYDTLFDLINLCSSTEKQNLYSYITQFLLSIIYQLMKTGFPVRNVNLQIVVIVNCIKASNKLQTHHFALLVLVELMKKTDSNGALSNIMPIFTFLGSTMVRLDDLHSVEIVSRILETLVPIVNVSDETYAWQLLNIFVISLPHIPEIRQVPIFIKLLQLLYNYQHLYYLLIFKNHAKITSQKTEYPIEYLKFTIQVSQELSTQQLLQMCIKVIHFFKALPTNFKEKDKESATIDLSYKHIFDMTEQIPAIFRHYKIATVQCLDGILSSLNFANRMTLLNPDEMNVITKHSDNLATDLILLIQRTLSATDEKPNDLCNARYQTLLLHHLYSILDAVNNMLPNVTFLKNITNMLKYHVPSGRKKVLEMLNARLLRRKFDKEEYVNLLQMSELLTKFFVDVVSIEKMECEITQSVLMCLKLLARLLARDHPNMFKSVLEMTTQIIKLKDNPLLTSALFCIAELCGSMGKHAIISMNNYVPAILDLITTNYYQKMPNMAFIGVAIALRNMIETLGDHLSPYLTTILFRLIVLSSVVNSENLNKEMEAAISHMKTAMQKVSVCISLQELLPAVKSTYGILLTDKFYQHIPLLIDMLIKSFINVPPEKMRIDNFIDFFLDVLRFREKNEDIKENTKTNNDAEITLKDIIAIEESASKAFTALILKLNADTFKSMYNQLCAWVAKTPHKERNITFYRVLANIVTEDLKSLFIPYISIRFLKRTALLLNSNNMFITDNPRELTLAVELNRIELVEMILLLLHRIYNHHKHHSIGITKNQFGILMQSIVDQLENTMGTSEEYENRASTLIIPCIGSFASVISQKPLQEKLIQRTLQKTKHAKPNVRIIALNALVEIASKLNKNFVQFLPVIAPFLTNLSKDEETKEYMQNTVCTLEEILGESLQNYF